MKKRLIILSVVAFLALVIIVNVFSSHGGTTNTPLSQPTPRPSSTVAKAVTTPTPGLFSQVTHGKPHVGGPVSDFVGKYGKSSDTTSPYNFPTDSNQDIVLTIYLTGAKVQQINVNGLSSWNKQTTLAFCAQYLPADAKVAGSSAQSTLYTSPSVGRFSVLFVNNGTAFISLAQG